MRVAIVGSRRRKDRGKVERLVRSLDVGDVVISGGCEGVDSWARDAALARGLAYEDFPPVKDPPPRDYFESCRRFYARNERIALSCDVMYAFVSPDRKGGTENAVKHARAYGKQVHLW